jgi:hypothetical protein
VVASFREQTLPHKKLNVPRRSFLSLGPRILLPHPRYGLAKLSVTLIGAAMLIYGWLRNLRLRPCNSAAHNCTDRTGDVTRPKLR